ncbi:hypothetical protein MNEG_14356 [Monoraphidium neglectum]|uniref:Calpain catalytic domain-containing protein n=1 Tax=Monoraphidium neglectum TaxID=145388 RepID=A0A0D2MEM5_9CHLO|nr:hypothetical protein MNEG_14356 [Monoraphidium neglectum]KIY93605.1 hypothetical protein MNEG_14356 [Monoraphidium neglectum]|eukprot:XP_013892625.1 hypothetical protein MNEG_14356 [Monoraphidium neglectum]
MEKAYAQLHGRYSALCGCLATHGAADGAGDAEGDAGCPGGGGGGGGGSAAGGSVAAALVDLTGGIPLKIKVDEEAGRVPCNSGMSHDDVGEDPLGALFLRLRGLLASGAILCCQRKARQAPDSWQPPGQQDEEGAGPPEGRAGVGWEGLTSGGAGVVCEGVGVGVCLAPNGLWRGVPYALLEAREVPAAGAARPDCSAAFERGFGFEGRGAGGGGGGGGGPAARLLRLACPIPGGGWRGPWAGDGEDRAAGGAAGAAAQGAGNPGEFWIEIG